MSAVVTITLPSHWFLVMPCGCVDGSLVSVRIDGTICAASAEQAWEQMTPRKRDREKESRNGWTVRGCTEDERSRMVEIFTTRCTHKEATT